MSEPVIITRDVVLQPRLTLGAIVVSFAVAGVYAVWAHGEVGADNGTPEAQQLTAVPSGTLARLTIEYTEGSK